MFSGKVRKKNFHTCCTAPCCDSSNSFSWPNIRNKYGHYKEGPIHFICNICVGWWQSFLSTLFQWLYLVWLCFHDWIGKSSRSDYWCQKMDTKKAEISQFIQTMHCSTVLNLKTRNWNSHIILKTIKIWDHYGKQSVQTLWSSYRSSCNKIYLV